MEENYLTQINAWATAHHTKFRSQTYGEPAVSSSSQRLVALPEGEGPQWRAFSTLQWASSANHLFGNNVTSAETFTWQHSPVFRATPLDMKAEADLHFLMGVNQIIGHGWPYSPSTGCLHGFQPWQMFEARILLESGLAALAAERGTKEHHVALAEEVAEMFALVDCPSDYLFHDVLFHRIISQACGNPILAALMETVTSSMYEARRKTVIDMRESAEMHRQIFRAIRAREPVDARRLMEQHLQLAQAAQGDGASRRGCPMRIRPAARTNHSHLFRMSHFDFNKAAAAIREKGVFN